MSSVEDVRAKVAVVIPVGPAVHHGRWLGECLQSVAAQTRPPSEVVFVDDMNGLFITLSQRELLREAAIPHHVYQPPWRLGVAHAFNHGSAVAFQHGADLALMLGADDLIEPRVIEAIDHQWEESNRADGFYFCEVLYSDGRQQTLACNAAAWTPGLFNQTGGFAVESASGGCDAAFISQMMVHKPRTLIQVPGNPNARYMARVHDQQQTWHQPPGMEAVRNWLTETYKDSDWGRYE